MSAYSILLVWTFEPIFEDLKLVYLVKKLDDGNAWTLECMCASSDFDLIRSSSIVSRRRASQRVGILSPAKGYEENGQALLAFKSSEAAVTS